MRSQQRNKSLQSCVFDHFQSNLWAENVLKPHIFKSINACEDGNKVAFVLEFKTKPYNFKTHRSLSLATFSSHLLLVFPQCLGIGYTCMFSRAWHLLSRASHRLHAFPRFTQFAFFRALHSWHGFKFFPRLPLVICYPALDDSRIFSRAWHQMYFGTVMHVSIPVPFLFFFSQYIRLYRIGPCGASIHAALKVFLDEKDSGPLILTHMYLLLGLAVPLWLYPVDYSKPDSTGECSIKIHKIYMFHFT